MSERLAHSSWGKRGSKHVNMIRAIKDMAGSEIHIKEQQIVVGS